jgi:hypothetical protein
VIEVHEVVLANDIWALQNDAVIAAPTMIIVVWIYGHTIALYQWMTGLYPRAIFSVADLGISQSGAEVRR